MYLQLTTKCNMKCAHCCFSCTSRGKHGDTRAILDALRFATQYTETITLGGGEPTLHPDFFQILEHALSEFDYVWLATNGSQTETMFRLARIMDDCDEDSFAQEDYCTCSSDDCECEIPYIRAYSKLSVDLSQDPFHDPIDERVVTLWRKRANQHAPSTFHIRDTSQHLIHQGRARKLSDYYETRKDCMCSDRFITPTGDIKPCGCTNAPVIGNVIQGFTDEGQKLMYENEGYQDNQCWNMRSK